MYIYIHCLDLGKALSFEGVTTHTLSIIFWLSITTAFPSITIVYIAIYAYVCIAHVVHTGELATSIPIAPPKLNGASE